MKWDFPTSYKKSDTESDTESDTKSDTESDTEKWYRKVITYSIWVTYSSLKKLKNEMRFPNIV